MKHYYDIIIIGGGAAGISAAISAKREKSSLSVAIIEKNDSIGKKILLTGNGRCNLGNLNLSNEFYTGSCKKIFPTVISKTQNTVDFFKKMGLETHSDSEGRIYPYSNKSTSVIEILKQQLEILDIDIYFKETITDIQKEKNQFSIHGNNNFYFAQKVIISVGGKSYPQTGSDGSFYTFFKNFNHKYRNFKPALVALKSNDLNLTKLKGCRLKSFVKAYDKDNTLLAQDAGEVQFNEHSISGICIMNLSAISDGIDIATVMLDLLPNKTYDQLYQYILWDEFQNYTLFSFLCGIFPTVVSRLLCDLIDENFGMLIKEIKKTKLQKLCSIIKNYSISINGTENWKNAQVTIGGVRAEEIDDTLESKKCNGLYFAGEVLDICGRCGGYNLEWAWKSGMYTGKNAACSIEVKYD